jgi:hypothetical protein
LPSSRPSLKVTSPLLSLLQWVPNMWTWMETRWAALRHWAFHPFENKKPLTTKQQNPQRCSLLQR